jgi:hypothetical protein
MTHDLVGIRNSGRRGSPQHLEPSRSTRHSRTVHEVVNTGIGGIANCILDRGSDGVFQSQLNSQFSKSLAYLVLNIRNSEWFRIFISISKMRN